MLLGDIAKTTSGREIAHGVARSVLEHVVGNCHEGILFTKHGAIFTNKGETVGIGVYHKTNVVASLTHEVANFAEVLLKGFGIVCEVSRRFAVELCHLRNPKLS